MLSTEDRRRCVDVPWSEGYTVPATAEILQRGERTIFRDRTALRPARALRIHPRFALEMAGDLMRQTESSVARQRRIARDTSISAMERIEELESVDRELGLDDPGRVQPRQIIREIVERGRTAAQIDRMIENKGNN